MTVFFQFEEVDSFVAGVIGEPGQRTFFLQLRHGETLVTMKCEKQQVAAIAEHFEGVLADLPSSSEGADSPGEGLLPLFLPTDDVQFVLGPIGLAFDRESDRFVVQLEELPPDDDTEPSSVRALLTAGQVERFCQIAQRLVAAGRKPCPFCGEPDGPNGHRCVRMN
jgi:uncharacterized repeat protein (TIGR03847 family)